MTSSSISSMDKMTMSKILLSESVKRGIAGGLVVRCAATPGDRDGRINILTIILDFLSSRIIKLLGQISGNPKN
jgi:hypothetical protein